MTIPWLVGVLKHRFHLLLAGGGIIYLGFYLATTHVQPQGSGGLSGPVNVRIFRSESHLLAFYPVYLAERWIRNGSLTYCAWRFNCDFADRTYVHHWLYGDGKYSHVWYDHWLPTLVFATITLAFTFALRRKVRCTVWLATTIGTLGSFLVVLAVFSRMELRSQEWASLTLKQKHGGGPVLQLRLAHSDAGVVGGSRSALHRHGGSSASGGKYTYSFENEVVAETTNSFRVLFRLKRPGVPVERVLIVFPFGEMTKTNWNGWKIQGNFL